MLISRVIISQFNEACKKVGDEDNTDDDIKLVRLSPFSLVGRGGSMVSSVPSVCRVAGSNPTPAAT